MERERRGRKGSMEREDNIRREVESDIYRVRRR